jgi:four helix bundle protein
MSSTDSRKFDLEDRLIEFASLIIDVVEKLPETKVGNHVGGQLLRAGTAPAPIYGEAQGAESRKDFVHKLKIGLKELRETRVWLKLIKRKSLIQSQDLMEKTLNECNELTAIFVKSIGTAQRNLKSQRSGGNIE